MLRGGDCLVLDDGAHGRRGGRAARAGVRHRAADAAGVGAVRVSHRQRPSAADDHRARARLPRRAGRRAAAAAARASRITRATLPFTPAHGRGRSSAIGRQHVHRRCSACCICATRSFPIGAFAYSDGLESATARRHGVDAGRPARVARRVSRRRRRPLGRSGSGSAWYGVRSATTGTRFVGARRGVDGAAAVVDGARARAERWACGC